MATIKPPSTDQFIDKMGNFFNSVNELEISKANEEKELSIQTKKIQEELEVCHSFLENYLMDVKKKLGDREIYIFNHHVLEDINDDLIHVETRELHFCPINIRKEPEKVAEAIENEAFLILNLNGEKPSFQFAKKWADLIERKKIKFLNIKNEENLIKQSFEVKEIKISEITPAEVHEVTTVIFKAVEMAFQVQSLEYKLKEIEKRRQNHHKINDIESERECLKKHLKEFLEIVKNCSIKDDDLLILVCQLLGYTNPIIHLLKEFHEEARKQEILTKDRELKARILKEEIKSDALKKEVIVQETLAFQIKKDEIKKGNVQIS